MISLAQAQSLGEGYENQVARSLALHVGEDPHRDPARRSLKKSSPAQKTAGKMESQIFNIN
jgi:hypothetical protein